MKTIEDAIQDYLRDLAGRQSTQTAETYAQALQRFKEYLSISNHSLNEPAIQLSVEDAILFANYLGERCNGEINHIAKTTLRTYLAGVSTFYRYLLREQVIDFSASDQERMRDALHSFRHGHRPIPKLPPEEAITALLSAAHQAKSYPKKPRLELARLRNIAMLEALRSSGMRVGELVGLKRDDLDYRAHSARVKGKGNKERIVYFDDAAWNAIQAYLKLRADGAKGRALYQLPLFARHDRRAGDRTLPLTTDSVRLVFNQLAQDAKIEIAMTPHSLRHAFATRVLDATSDLALVQDMLGHSSPTTTRIYAKVSDKKMRQAHRTAFGYDETKDDKSE